MPMRKAPNESMYITIRVPLVAPLGYPVTKDMLQDVWNAFVKPDQESNTPQSGETRVLMAILRALYAADWPVTDDGTT